MTSSELPERKLQQAISESATNELFDRFMASKGLSLTEDVWDLPHEEVVAVRALAAIRGMGVESSLDPSTDSEESEMAMVVGDHIFVDMMTKPLPSNILDIKPDDRIDPRDGVVPIIPNKLRDQLEQDFIDYQNGWDKLSKSDIEI